MNVFCAAIVAFVTGLGVYRSCTKYQRILGTALTIDAVAAALLIAVLYATGALT